jgi:hypothetical protein
VLVLRLFVDPHSVPGKVALRVGALPTAAIAVVPARQLDIAVE